MHLRHLPFPLILLIGALAADEKCDFDLGNGAKYTLPGGVNTASRELDQPPSKQIEHVSFNLCGPLPVKEDVPEGDRCPKETSVCYTKSYKKGETTTIVSVVPAGINWKDNSKSSLLPKQEGLTIEMTGSSYSNEKQSSSITLKCAKETSSPVFDSYSNGVVSLTWSLPEACIAKNDNTKPVTTPEPNSGLSLGYFFLLMFIVALAYFSLGAYYNYTTYAKTGWDAVPHKIFLQEVPYLLRDLASHLCSVVRPRTRSGYVSLG